MGEVLSIDSIGIYDNFLELGGDSISATRIEAWLVDRFGLDDSPLLLENPTVTELAAIIPDLQSQGADDDKIHAFLD